MSLIMLRLAQAIVLGLMLVIVAPMSGVLIGVILLCSGIQHVRRLTAAGNGRLP